MSKIIIWIHAVWGTKSRYPYLEKPIKDDVRIHIREKCELNGIAVAAIDGSADHLHILLKMRAEMSISKIMQLIKGESSRWINKNKLTPIRFDWADEYSAGSVSPGNLSTAKKYIDTQELHHGDIPFEEEAERVLGLSRLARR
jgi:putative transposase